VWENNLALDTVLTGSPNGSKILVASSNGNVLLYDANAGSFVASRQDFSSLSGSYAASAFNQYVVGASLLDPSLAPVAQMDTSTGTPSGFSFVTTSGLRTTTANSSSPGVIQRVNLSTGGSISPTRMIEAPLPGAGASGSQSGATCTTVTTASTSTATCVNGGIVSTQVCTITTSGGTTTQTCNTQTSTIQAASTVTTSAFTRTLAVLYDQSEIISTTTSGFTVLPWTYDAAVAPPSISAVVSAADGTSPVAPGGLITIFGSQLNPTNLATSQIPLPTALGDSCVTVNGQLMPIIFVSPTQINAQMPFQAIGDTVVVVHTPGGISDNFDLTIEATAPAVFLSASAGPLTNLPTVMRASDGLLISDSDPVHPGDTLMVYLTGMGQVSPSLITGLPGPGNPLATALAPPTVNLGGVNLPVLYAGLAPGEVGVYQINVMVPTNAPQGLSVPVTITQGDSTNTLNLPVVQ
jgi:uncharacterized protein (TIGR03437 family)